MIQTFNSRMRMDRQALVWELEKVEAKFKGNECACPYHDDRRASAGIYEDNMGVWRFRCQAAGCGFGGDYWDVRARNENKTLAELFRETAPGPDRKTRAKIYERLSDAESELTRLAEGQLEARYEYTHPDTHKIELVVLRIITAGGKTFRQVCPAGAGWVANAPAKPWPLYNRTRMIKSKEVIVVEGEAKVHALHAYGFVATTSPCGAGKAAHADWTPLADKKVILWPDNDEAGRKHIAEVRDILQKLSPAPNINQIDTLNLALQAKEDVVDFIRHAKGLDIKAELQNVFKQVKSAGMSAEVGRRIEDIIGGTWAAVGLPWKSLDHYVHPLLPGCVCLFVGSVGHGKSLMLLQCLTQFHAQGYRVACYELEEDRTYHLSRILSQQAGLPDLIDPEWVRNNQDLARMRYAEYKDFLESFGHCLWATPDNQPTLVEVAEWTEQRAKEGYRIIAIDPITAAAGTDKPWIADNAFLQRIKRAASDSGCSIILVTHPTKTYTGPDVNQLAGSAAYSRFAQSIIWLKAHEPKDNTVKGIAGTVGMIHNRSLHILKARNGKGGGLVMAFDFNHENLMLNELGIIVKTERSKTHDYRIS